VLDAGLADRRVFARPSLDQGHEQEVCGCLWPATTHKPLQPGIEARGYGHQAFLGPPCLARGGSAPLLGDQVAGPAATQLAHTDAGVGQDADDQLSRSVSAASSMRRISSRLSTSSTFRSTLGWGARSLPSSPSSLHQLRKRLTAER